MSKVSNDFEINSIYNPAIFTKIKQSFNKEYPKRKAKEIVFFCPKEQLQSILNYSTILE